MLLTPILALFALGAPYLLLAFVEWQFDPQSWFALSRIVLALIYAFYGYLVITLLAEARTGRNRKA